MQRTQRKSSNVNNFARFCSISRCRFVPIDRSVMLYSLKPSPINALSNKDNIYDILRRMVPVYLDIEKAVKSDDVNNETLLINVTDLLLDKTTSVEYFNTDAEEKDVEAFINKYVQKKSDIIDMLKDFLKVLSQKWNIKWPEGLSNYYVKANACYNIHIDAPTSTEQDIDDLHLYIAVNLLAEEFNVNNILNKSDETVIFNNDIINHLDFILRISLLKPEVFENCNDLKIIWRFLWLKLHIYMFHKEEDLALDCLYQLFDELEELGEDKISYNLTIINFTFKPVINEREILEYITFLERNKKLSTVNDLFQRNCYEDVLNIIIDSFEHCRTLAKEQENEMSLDFAVQLSLILDCYWALEKVGECFRWSLICLHEALKHYFRFTSGTTDYDKWTLAVVKILSCIEHLLSTEGFSCLDDISSKELSQGLEDLIRIIGHQMETKVSEMPLNTVSPWIIMHYILQREEDQGRGRPVAENDKTLDEEIPNPLMILFIAHDELGNKGWCGNSNGKILYFILDSVVPLLRAPALTKSLESICQYMEQCVFCLYGHRRNKVKYLESHTNITPNSLDWVRAQQLYEIFRPPVLPALEGKVSGISMDVQAIFHRILELLPAESNPQMYIPDLDKYIKGIDMKLPSFPTLLPYKMKDIYFLLGDYHFKKDEVKLAVKYNMMDVIINRDRLESWAQISLAKACILEIILNSCKNLKNEREFLNPAKSTIRCFKRALEINPTHCVLWIEYGNFVYSVHSFVSRLLKQASESLSMEEFEALEKQKEDLLDTTQKCFTTVLDDLDTKKKNGRKTEDEDSWLLYYMLGKVAEKRNKPPSLYLNYYMKGVKCLQEADATYPAKINYYSPTLLCIEVLELHYRIPASILKYIEQHENKPIPASIGKVFSNFIEKWKQSPFINKPKKESTEVRTEEPSVQAANILKRSISDAGEEYQETKKLKQESAAAKVRRSASYDTERNKDVPQSNLKSCEKVVETGTEATEEIKNIATIVDKGEENTDQENKVNEVTKSSEDAKEGESSSSSSSSSDSSSSESSSDSSDSGRESNSSKSSNEFRPITDEEIMKIVSGCIDALEDCATRFPPHYKAIYRLAHYHFYYKKGKDIERCRDLMLSSFMTRAGQKLSGLFSEKKTNNFFNNIWKIPVNEVDRGGSFAFHMNRSVLLTMEILKEIDDHKTLLDLSLHLQRTPDQDKKYLRDSDREELAQQAFSLCVQALKGQLIKFSQQPDIKSNEVERQALKSLMVDIYRTYQKVQKLPLSKQFVNLMIDAYKLIITTPINEGANLVDLSLKFCQTLNSAFKQQAIVQANLDKTQNMHKKLAAQQSKLVESKIATATQNTLPAPVVKPQPAGSTSVLPKIPSDDITKSFQHLINEALLNQQRTFSYLSNINALASYSLPNPLQFSAQNSFQAEYYRQFLNVGFPYKPPVKKQKRDQKLATSRPRTSKTNTKSFSAAVKQTPTPVIASLPKSVSSLTSSMGTVLPTLPASMTANLPSFTTLANTLPQAQMSSASSTSVHSKPVPHQTSPGKTLQEKLAERQKNIPVSKATTLDISASISRLPSSLTITKTKPIPTKKPEPKKLLPDANPKQIDNEIIILDDD